MSKTLEAAKLPSLKDKIEASKPEPKKKSKKKVARKVKRVKKK